MIETLPTSTHVAGYIRWRLKEKKSPYVDNITYINRVLFFSYACALSLGYRLCDESPHWTEHGFTFFNPIIDFNDLHESTGMYPMFAIHGFSSSQQDVVKQAVDAGLTMVGDYSASVLIKIQRLIPRWTEEKNRRKAKDLTYEVVYSLPDKELLEWMQSSPIITKT